MIEKIMIIYLHITDNYQVKKREDNASHWLWRLNQTRINKQEN